MSTGDHLALGAVAALAALGLASRRRRGSRAVDMGKYERMLALNFPPVQAWRHVGGTGSPPGTTAKAPSRQSVTQAPKTTRKKTTRKKTTPTKASPKKAKVAAKQQAMINQILEKMGPLTKTEQKVYTTKLNALTEDQVRQLQTQCDQEAA
jgi:hypothetical protein